MSNWVEHEKLYNHRAWIIPEFSILGITFHRILNKEDYNRFSYLFSAYLKKNDHLKL